MSFRKNDWDFSAVDFAFWSLPLFLFSQTTPLGLLWKTTIHWESRSTEFRAADYFPTFQKKRASHACIVNSSRQTSPSRIDLGSPPALQREAFTQRYHCSRVQFFVDVDKPRGHLWDESRSKLLTSKRPVLHNWIEKKLRDPRSNLDCRQSIVTFARVSPLFSSTESGRLEYFIWTEGSPFSVCPARNENCTVGLNSLPFSTVPLQSCIRYSSPDAENSAPQLSM